MRCWIDDLLDAAESGESQCVVTVVRTRGSAPREAGARMLVSERHVTGSIGGGNLEHQCVSIAAAIIRDERSLPSHRSIVLGSGSGQCCGGIVDVLFEPVTQIETDWLSSLRELRTNGRSFAVVGGGERPHFDILADDPEIPGELWSAENMEFRQRIAPPAEQVVLFGAGHVGSAVVDALAPLDCEILWLDSRTGVLPESSPANVKAEVLAQPATAVARIRPGAYCLVMTHSHPMDFAITDAILRRGDAAYCGLIGSLSKRRRFERQFRKEGLDCESLAALVCPIGIDGITGKRPAEIATSVAADLLRRWENAASATEPRRLRALV